MPITGSHHEEVTTQETRPWVIYLYTSISTFNPLAEPIELRLYLTMGLRKEIVVSYPNCETHISNAALTQIFTNLKQHT